MKLTRKALPLLTVLHGLNKHLGKAYCFPSQDKILELLVKFVSLKISRRQLNYDLRDLERSGVLRRTRRHRRTPKRGMEFRSTLYEISVLGYNLLVRAGVMTWAALRAIIGARKERECTKRKPCASLEPAHGFSSVIEALGGAFLASP